MGPVETSEEGKLSGMFPPPRLGVRVEIYSSPKAEVLVDLHLDLLLVSDSTLHRDLEGNLLHSQ